MSGMLLFESLQFLDEELLEECEGAAEGAARPRGIRRLGALAACCVIAAGAALLLPRILQTEPRPYTEASASPGLCGAADPEPHPWSDEATPPAPGPAAEPEPLYWNDLPELPAVLGSWYLLVGEALTEEELAVCAPGTEEWWIEGCEGYAAYIGAEGVGGLAWVTLLVSAERLEDPIQVTLRDVNAPVPPPFPGGLPGPEEAHAGRVNDQEYRAFRCYYEDGEGEKRVWLAAVFEKEGMEFTLAADVPEAQEKTAGTDLLWLLAAYTDLPAPDLSGFRFGEHPSEGE